jgi:hypothetical protein
METKKMKKTIQKLSTILIILALGIITAAAPKDERLTLRNGKGKSEVTLNPSRTYRFLINAREFSTLSVALATKGGKIEVQIKSPSGKIVASGTGKRFTIRKGKKVEKGDYQIILKNIGNSLASVGMKLGDIKGESTKTGGK